MVEVVVVVILVETAVVAGDYHQLNRPNSPAAASISVSSDMILDHALTLVELEPGLSNPPNTDPSSSSAAELEDVTACLCLFSIPILSISRFFKCSCVLAGCRAPPWAETTVEVSIKGSERADKRILRMRWTGRSLGVICSQGGLCTGSETCGCLAGTSYGSTCWCKFMELRYRPKRGELFVQTAGQVRAGAGERRGAGT